MVNGKKFTNVFLVGLDIFSKIIETADTDEISIDSTFVKVHQHALSGSKKGAVLVNPKEAKQPKFTLLSINRPIKINLSAGNINDSLLFEEQIKGINLEKVIVLADRGYSTYEIIEKLREKGATICIPPKSNMKIIWSYDKEVYKFFTI